MIFLLCLTWDDFCDICSWVFMKSLARLPFVFSIAIVGQLVLIRNPRWMLLIFFTSLVYVWFYHRLLSMLLIMQPCVIRCQRSQNWSDPCQLLFTLASDLGMQTNSIFLGSAARVFCVFYAVHIAKLVNYGPIQLCFI